MKDKIVVQFGDRILKGYTDRAAWSDDWNAAGSLASPPIHLLEADAPASIPLHGAKAIFFVHSFEGKKHEDLRFHDTVNHKDCLWIRIRFHDDELIEGTILNSCEFVVREGFFLSPIDPEGNNWLVYVRKSHIKDLHILGLRPLPPESLSS